MKTILLIGASASAMPFAGRDFRVVTTHTFRDGVSLARLHNPAAIVYVVDGQPAFDSLIRDLEADPILASIPVIVVAEQMTYTDLRCWMDAGADDCLAVESLPDGLAAAIHARLLKREAIGQRYDVAMDTLRYSISAGLPHEFRTALQGILGFSSMLREDCDTLRMDEIREMARNIETSATRMQRQVESFAWYARLRAQEIAGEGSSFTRGRTCQAPAAIVEALAWQHAQSANRVSDLFLSVDNAHVHILDEYVQKIVDEVIDNAFKFSSPGTQVSVQSSINGYYSVAVQDSGRGMTAEQIKQLGAYMQYDRKIYEQQGAGLGLTIARGLAKLHGGDVTVKSLPGVGTTVVIALPLADPDQADLSRPV